MFWECEGRSCSLGCDQGVWKRKKDMLQGDVAFCGTMVATEAFPKLLGAKSVVVITEFLEGPS